MLEEINLHFPTVSQVSILGDFNDDEVEPSLGETLAQNCPGIMLVGVEHKWSVSEVYRRVGYTKSFIRSGVDGGLR